MSAIAKIWNSTLKYKFNILYWLVVGLLIFFMAFKGYEVGTDSATYQIFYDSIASGKMPIHNDKIEIGYSFYCFLLSRIGLNYLGFQIITAIIINLSFAIIFYLLSKNKFLSITLYVLSSVYFFGYNGVRQCLATCFILFGILAIVKNKKLWWVYIATVFFATLFHKSALLYLPAIVGFFIKLDWKKALTLFALAGILMLFCEPICIFFAKNFNISYLNKYIDSELFTQSVDIKSLCLTIAYSLLLIGIFIYEKLIVKKEIEKSWVKNLFMVSILFRFCSIFGCFSYLLLRVSDLFYWSIILLIPEIISITKNVKLKKCIYLVTIVAFSVLMTIQIFVFKNSGIIPYSFAFN